MLAEKYKIHFSEKQKGSIMKIIDSKTAISFLLPRHYSGRKPQVLLAFGWFVDEELQAVCTFAKPVSNSLCKGICGQENSQYVFELNRLCRLENFKEPLSKFVAFCLRYISKNKHWIIVSYSDTGMNHCGYIYQACNFIYTGRTNSRRERYQSTGKIPKHTRHHNFKQETGERLIRTKKHRYVYFATKQKKLKKNWKNALNYKPEKYPKEENKNYVLGTFQKAKIETQPEYKEEVQKRINQIKKQPKQNTLF